MRDGNPTLIGFQILLRNVRDVVRFLVLREQVIVWLIFMGPNFLGYCFIPLIGIGKDRIDVENHASKREQTMTYNLSDLESCRSANRIQWNPIDEFESVIRRFQRGFLRFLSAKKPCEPSEWS